MSVSNHPFIKVGNHVRFYLLNIRKASAKRWPASFEDGQCLFFLSLSLDLQGKHEFYGDLLAGNHEHAKQDKHNTGTYSTIQYLPLPDEDFRVKG